MKRVEVAVSVSISLALLALLVVLTIHRCEERRDCEDRGGVYAPTDEGYECSQKRGTHGR